MNFAKFGEGYVTYFAAFGLVAIGLYVVFTKDPTSGMAIITLGIGLAGNRRAVDNSSAKVAAQVSEVKSEVAVVQKSVENVHEKVEDVSRVQCSRKEGSLGAI